MRVIKEEMYHCASDSNVDLLDLSCFDPPFSFWSPLALFFYILGAQLFHRFGFERGLFEQRATGLTTHSHNTA
jgi:hypothetical protein